VSTRQLISKLGKPETKMGEIMETELITVDIDDDQEEVADKVARYDLLAIPVVDDQHRMLGIITYDDIIDVVRDEATEDAHRIAGVDPLEESYLRTGLLTLSWKRGIWLAVLFLFALITAFALKNYELQLEKWEWLVFFIPLIISSGGNTGSQSATLIITALVRRDIALADWWIVIRRELMSGLILGGFLALLGFFAAYFLLNDNSFPSTIVLPLTVMLVVLCGTLFGSVLPLIFQRLGLDPALMSSPFVAGLIDIVGIVIYLNVAMWLLT
jgi:magnesium transporter